jgi:hypothetical protein
MGFGIEVAATPFEMADALRRSAWAKGESQQKGRARPPGAPLPTPFSLERVNPPGRADCFAFLSRSISGQLDTDHF